MSEPRRPVPLHYVPVWHEEPFRSPLCGDRDPVAKVTRRRLNVTCWQCLAAL